MMSKKVKVMVMKMYVVNGKKMGKSVTLNLDPEEMAKYKTEATVRKKLADYVAKSGVYKLSELDGLKYDMREFLEEWKKLVTIVEAEKLAELDKSENNPEAHQPHYDLMRFLDAQEFAYTQALRELKEGRKRSHWIWYIFPQQKGLGHSHNSNYYGLDGEGEARAYMEHPVLGDRLRECCKALLLHKDKDIEYIMGSEVDVLKLNTSMNLFNRMCPNDVFRAVLDTFF